MGEVIKSSWVSEKRLQEYLDAAGGDESRASDLYAWNAEVSSALFEVIHHFEVLLRNTIIHQLEKDGPGPNVPPGSPWVQNEGAVAEVSARLARLKKDPTAARVYSGLTFGFWQRLFGSSYVYDELWRHTLRFVFRHHPKVDRSIVAAHLEAVNRLRNRIAHHRSLLERDTRVEVRRIVRLIRWIDPAAAEWVSSIERVTQLAARRPVVSDRDVIVVAAADAWHFYATRKQNVYVAPVGRSFPVISRIGFYADQQIQAVFPAVLEHRINVDWTKANASRLLKSSVPHDATVGAAIRAASQPDFPLSAYQVFILSSMNDPQTTSLPAPISHSKRGRGSAFIQGRRYFSMSALQSASDTDDLA